jgi:hypothetical protein
VMILMVIGSGFGTSKLPQTLKTGQRRISPTVYRDMLAASPSHRLLAQHSSLLTPSMSLAAVTPAFHPTHQSNGDCALALSPNLTNWKELSKPKQFPNILV